MRMTKFKILLKIINLIVFLLVKTLRKKTPLFLLAIYWKLDKSFFFGFHNYAKTYSQLFKPIRSVAKNVLEIGIGSTENGQMSHMLDYGYKTGNSLRFLRDYFYNANILGLDLFKVNIKDRRIKTGQLDQSNEKDLKSFAKLYPFFFDVIIDDGSHESRDQYLTFKNFFSSLKNGGVYIVEDVKNDSVKLLVKKIKNLVFFSKKEFKISTIYGSKGKNDNLLIIEKFKF